MADRGRDLTLNLVTDQSRFDTDAAAQGLQETGDAAQDAARRLGDLDDAAGDATRSLGDLDGGTGLSTLTGDADTARASLGDLGDTAKAAGDDVAAGMADGAEAGSGAFGDMRDEAGAALMEIAGSFDGTMQGAIDGVQGALPAIGAAFGAIGLVAGSAASIGMGLFKAGAEAAAERVAGLTERLRGLRGEIDRADFESFVAGLTDEGKLADLAEDAKDLGVTLGTLTRAMYGEKDAAAEVADAIEALGGSERERAAAAEAAAQGSAVALDATLGLSRETRALASDTAAAETALALEAQALEGSAEAADELTAAHEAAAESTAAIADSLSTVAEAAGAMAEDVQFSLEAANASLLEQITAARDYATNMDTIYNEVGQSGLDFVQAQGENAAQAAALLAAAPDEQREEVVGNWQALGQATSAATAAGITDGIPGVQAAAQTTMAQTIHALEAGAPGAHTAGANAGNSFAAGVGSAAEQARREAQAVRQAAIDVLQQSINVTPNVAYSAAREHMRHYP